MASLPHGLHGAHLRAELVARVGLPAVRAALADRRLTKFSRAVLVSSPRAADFRTRAAAALLFAGPDAVLTGHSALALYGCSAADRAPIHVLVPYHRNLRRREGVIVHHGGFVDVDIDQIDGLLTLSIDVALAEVLCRGSRRSALACADQAFGQYAGLERAELMAWTEYRILERPDPRGRRQARELLNLATGLPESPPESWMLLCLVEAGFPPPQPQFPILDINGNEIYRLDFAWPELRIAVEYDGYAAHELSKARDARRDEDLRRRGWIVIRANMDDLRDPGRLLAEIVAAFHARGMAA